MFAIFLGVCREVSGHFPGIAREISGNIPRQSAEKPLGKSKLKGAQPRLDQDARSNLQASLKDSPTQSPKELVKIPQGNRPRMSPGCGQESPRILKDSQKPSQDNDPNIFEILSESQKHLARLAQDSPRQSPKHSTRALPKFPAQCERLPQGLPKELATIPQAPCKISH